MREYSKEEVLRRLNPLVARWFDTGFEDLTPPQRYAIVPIMEGRNVLVSSPTGSGKTLTAFLTVINELFNLALRGELKDRIYAVYISPLRALGNDIYRNLQVPLEGIADMARSKGVELPEIRHAVRTGDTSQSERQKQLRRPPHILITTPETFAIVLTAPKFREKLRSVKWVIIDEIHSLVENKRGSHLSLSLERFSHFLGRDFVRIGLSATINPLEEVASFLVGVGRRCLIVDTRFAKRKDLRVLAPVSDMIHKDVEEQQRKLYDLVARLVSKHKTSLIFTNTRSGAERVTFHLKQRFKDVEEIREEIAAHHSSLSRDVRLRVEDLMKRGKLRAIVSSTSLELGIDVGSIDLVIQIGSPKSVTRAVQRAGRSGHGYKGTIKARFISMDRDDAIELAVMVNKALEGFLDRVHIPEKPLDVLAQQLVGMAIEKRWTIDEALNVIRKAYPYRNLSKEELISVLKYLSGENEKLRGRKVYGKIWFDEEDMTFGRRGRTVRAIYMTNVGTIPEQTGIRVHTIDGRFVGKLEEEFHERLCPGDRFVLSGKVFEYVGMKRGKAIVKPAFDQRPTVPSWYSEMLPLSFDLALEIGKFRRMSMRLLADGRDEMLRKLLRKKCRANDKAVEVIYKYLKMELEYLRSLGLGPEDVPSDRVIGVECFLDEEGRYRQIFLSLFGRRVNDALSRALGYLAFSKIGEPVGISITDNGFSLTYPLGHEPCVGFRDLLEMDLRNVLERAVGMTDLMRSRFRHVATRGLMILRSYKGYEISVAKQRITAESLMRIVMRMKNFPLLRETYREILEDYMDIKNAIRVLDWVRSGRMRIADLGLLEVPTPFAQSVALESLSDVIFMEDRIAVLREFEERLRKIMAGEARQR